MADTTENGTEQIEQMIGDMTAKKALDLLSSKASPEADDMLGIVALVQADLMLERDVGRGLSMSRREDMAREWMTAGIRASNARKFMMSFLTVPLIANGHRMPHKESYALAEATSYGHLDLLVSFLMSELIAMAEEEA